MSSSKDNEIKEITGFIHDGNVYISILQKKKAHLGKILKCHGFENETIEKIVDVIVHDLDDISEATEKKLYVYNDKVYDNKEEIEKP